MRRLVILVVLLGCVAPVSSVFARMSSEEIIVSSYRIQSLTWTAQTEDLRSHVLALNQLASSDPILREWLEKRKEMLEEQSQQEFFSNDTYEANRAAFETFQYHLQDTLKNAHPVNDKNLLTSIKLLELVQLYSFLSGDDSSKEMLGMYPFAEEGISDIDKLFKSPTPKMKKIKHIWKYIRTGLVSGRYEEASIIQRYGFNMAEQLLGLKK